MTESTAFLQEQKLDKKILKKCQLFLQAVKTRKVGMKIFTFETKQSYNRNTAEMFIVVYDLVSKMVLMFEHGTYVEVKRKVINTFNDEAFEKLQ